MSEFKTPLDNDLNAVKQKFIEFSQVEDVLSPSPLQLSEQASTVSPSALFVYAKGGDDKSVEVALAENISLRRLFRDMVGKGARYHVPEAMAASSSDDVVGYIARTGKGCKIRMEPSRAEPDQVYVIIELSDAGKMPPTTLVVCDIESNCSRFPLPKIRNGVMQVIASKDSDLVRLLSNPKTEAFIR